MEKIIISNSDKCIGCGLCVEDCVGACIRLENGKAVFDEGSCIRCGHCEAICPSNAVSLTGFEDKTEEIDEATRLDPKELLMAIKSRRSIRNFSDKKVDEEIIDMIIEAGRLAPTGTNSQGTSYIVLDKKKEECEKLAVATFKKLLNTGKKIIPMLTNLEIDDNFFFKKAPLVIVILGKDKVSASLAAQNMAFMAEANGLGVLFSGFFTMCYNMLGKIRKCIGKDGKAVTTLVIGYPSVKYKRTVHRNKAQVYRA